MHRGLTKAKGGTDLGAVVLYGTSLPVIARKLLCRDADLYGDRGDGGRRQLLYREGEAASVLKELQQYGEAEPSGTGLIGQQRRLGRQKGPVFR